jgi:hypothetical protein
MTGPAKTHKSGELPQLAGPMPGGQARKGICTKQKKQFIVGVIFGSQLRQRVKSKRRPVTLDIDIATDKKFFARNRQLHHGKTILRRSGRFFLPRITRGDKDNAI